MPIAQGVYKQTRIKRQTAKGTIAGTSGGQIIRRETSTFELAKETYDTGSEITSKQQITSVRHGPRMVNGSINGLLSPGTYSDIMAAILRRDFTTVTSITGASITIAGTGPTYTVTRAAGSFLTDGIKIGMVGRLSAGSFNGANLNKNLFITAVTALSLTVIPLNGVALVAEGPIASATFSIPGKVTYAADSSQTNIYYTVEEYYPDLSPVVSERSTDVKFTQAVLQLPGSGNAKVQLTAIGLDQTSAAAAYYTAPSSETTTDVVVAASGALLVNGASVATVTDLNVTINGNGAAADAVVGANVRPDVFSGKVIANGSFTAYYDGGTIPDLFTNETATSIVAAFAAGTAANADFITLALTAVKLSSNTPQDGETGLKRSYNFTAYYNAAGGAALANTATTVQIQDSQAA